MAEARVEQSGIHFLDLERNTASHSAWAGHLIALGARLARHDADYGSQLVVGLVLPARDYAALLISVGWTLAQRPAQRQENPLDEAEQLRNQIPVPVRMAAGSHIIAGPLYGIRHDPSGNRLHIGNSEWRADKIAHIEAAPGLPPHRFGRAALTTPGSLVRWTGHGDSWAADNCRSGAYTAVIGTRTLLLPELDLPLRWSGAEGGFQPMRDILRPDDGRSPCWGSTILPGATGDLPDLPPETKLAVLDGASATRWLPVIETPTVVVIIDGSSMDERAAEILLQTRATGSPVTWESLGWKAKPGTQALAFRVGL
ncbi:hypothetical protein ACF1BR_04405 [Streptomyces rubiginosohelvolus]|uniref:hypothetical protein n=1 Tax=Streptomyces rubiginosohelvolus TaxID=67362 RepID=UPI003702460C